MSEPMEKNSQALFALDAPTAKQGGFSHDHGYIALPKEDGFKYSKCRNQMERCDRQHPALQLMKSPNAHWYFADNYRR